MPIVVGPAVVSPELQKLRIFRATIKSLYDTKSITRAKVKAALDASVTP